MDDDATAYRRGLAEDATDDLRAMDRQPLAPAEARDVAALRSLMEDISSRQGIDVSPVLREWAAAMRAQLSQPLDKFPSADLVTRTYTTYDLSATSGTRTYTVEVRVDDNFDNIKTSVRDRVQVMLDRAVQDQTSRFVERAQDVGLDSDWRRPKSRPFPHVLPYLTPAPTTATAIQAEEAGVVTAAAHFALSRSEIRLDVNQYSKGPKVTPTGKKLWSCGFATVNSYNSDLALVVNLNERAIREAGFSDNFWAGTVAHEVLHTLGWGHPNGSYPDDLPIEIWQWCIETVGGSLVEEPKDVIAIR